MNTFDIEKHADDYAKSHKNYNDFDHPTKLLLKEAYLTAVRDLAEFLADGGFMEEYKEDRDK